MLDQQELGCLPELCRLCREFTDPPVLWRQLLEQVVRVFRASSGCLAEVKEETGWLKIQAGIGLPEGVVGSEMRPGTGILGLVAAEGKPRLLNGNLSQDQKLADRLPQRRGPAPWSAMCWPLILDGRVLGVISVNRVQGMEAFSEADLERGGQLIQFISVAAGNMQLNLELRQELASLKKQNQMLQDEINSLNGRI